MAKKGDWVRIHKVILKPEERTGKLPEDTKKVPLEMWTKGYLLHDGDIGEEVEIETVCGRHERGTLTEVNPYYTHSFGRCVPELLAVDRQVREIVFGGEK
ncbi:MAG TPA: 2-amino-4-ketopentanoate thiolase [Candidatus Copromorpha excrementigallinarum]|uniref:2-amino-4-ketopentanoate thiolase n=1 Tax=Candidatus Allocopromorpha excrementigallinarum TaxID=2840742 RepID=A0A9D1I157_9FIRM|nr:2-amino-4-ketopentanoate thiolase [Candidatus Copromorpha excrementigallinarum]